MERDGVRLTRCRSHTSVLFIGEKYMRYLRMMVSVVALGIGVISAAAATISDTNSVSFVSSANPAKKLLLDSFDTSLGILTEVKIEFWSSSQVLAMVDNDDPYSTAQAQAKMTRQWSATGPDVTTGDLVVITTPIADLAADDGDGIAFDLNPPDGYDFGAVSYTDQAAGVFYPLPLSLYETVGPDKVSFNVTPTVMINELYFVGDAPDAWRQDLQDPSMTITAKVTYTYIPEPMSLLMMGLGGVTGNPPTVGCLTDRLFNLSEMLRARSLLVIGRVYWRP